MSIWIIIIGAIAILLILLLSARKMGNFFSGNKNRKYSTTSSDGYFTGSEGSSGDSDASIRSSSFSDAGFSVGGKKHKKKNKKIKKNKK